MEIVELIDARNPAIAERRDNVRSDRRILRSDRTDRQTCVQNRAILFRREFENPVDEMRWDCEKTNRIIV